MKCEKYLGKLDNLNEEFEEGLLLELHEKPPANLHGEIMRSLHRERKRVNFLNYRIYAPAVAAVLIFAVVINRPDILEKISFIKNAKITQEKTIANGETTDPRKNLKQDQTDKISGDKNNESGDTSLNQGPVADPTTVAANENTEKNSLDEPKSDLQGNKGNAAKDQEIDKNTITASNNGQAKTDASAGKGNIATEEKDNENGNFDFKELLGLIFYNEPDINYEIILNENKSTILNYITENHVEKFNAANTYRLSMEQFEGLDKLLSKYSIGMKAVKDAESATSRIIKIYLMNYSISVNTSAPEVVGFIEDQSKCIRLNNSTYKILADDMKELDKRLSAAGIKKELINESVDKYIVFKVSILNYEAAIDATQSALSDFIKNTGKCKPVGDNVYSMGRETLNEFKELLKSFGLELKVLNETNNNSVTVKIKNI